MTYSITFPAYWIDGDRLDGTLVRWDPLASPDPVVIFHFPSGCRLMIDAAVRLLSLIHQLVAQGRSVCLSFGVQDELMGYLDRLGFLDQLPEGVGIEPERPVWSAAETYRQQNPGLVEIEILHPSIQDKRPVKVLSRRLEGMARCEAQHSRLKQAAFTLFSESIQNVWEHSQTQLNGYAALQAYVNAQRPKVKVVVSDSGIGILGTLRPALRERYPHLAGYSDPELLLEAFRSGVSRKGSVGGCGLHSSALHALKFNAEVSIRMPQCRLRFRAGQGGYTLADIRHVTQELPQLQGTHICFDFYLDT